MGAARACNSPAFRGRGWVGLADGSWFWAYGTCDGQTASNAAITHRVLIASFETIGATPGCFAASWFHRLAHRQATSLALPRYLSRGVESRHRAIAKSPRETS